MIMEYTHDEYCNMSLMLGTRNSRAAIAAWEYDLLYPGRCHLDTVYFSTIEAAFPFGKKECSTYGTLDSMSLMGCTDSSQ
jgi:hypothetical protein